MKPLSFFRAAVAVSFAGLLAACGGNDAATALPEGSPAFVQPAWASPAMLLSPGQSSKSHSLSGCFMESSLIVEESSQFDQPSNEQPLRLVGNPIYTVTLVISSSGTLTVNGATATTATIGPLLSYASGSAAERYRQLEVNASNGGVSRLLISGSENSIGGSSFNLNQSSQGVIFYMSASNETSRTSIRCDMFGDAFTQTFALSVPPSDSRTQAIFVPAGQTSRLSWAGQGEDSLEGIGLNNGGSVLNLDQATGIMSLSDSTATTATLRPLSISGAAYFSVAGSSSQYVERWGFTPAEGQTPALEERSVNFNAYVPAQNDAPPVLNLDVVLCSSTGPVRNGYCSFGK